MSFFSTVLGDLVGGGAVNGVSGAVSGIADTGAALTAFFYTITDGTMWRSLGWILLGIVMVAAGLALWAKNTAVPAVRGAVGV